MSMVAFSLFGQSNCDTQRDSIALAAFFQRTNGVEWIENTHWLVPGQPIDEWYGVTTNAEGCVTSLILDSNNLHGQLSMDLAQLESLQTLRLGENELQGVLSSDIMNLPQLDTLDLHSNALSGSFPSDLPTNGVLRFLNIDRNDFSGPLPEEISRLSHLEYLSIDYNSFSSIPDDIFDLVNLRLLSLNALELNPFNNKVGQLRNLEVLSASFNRGISIPDSIVHLKELKFLSIQGNNISNPRWELLQQLTKLEVLGLGYNNIDGPIPSEIASFSNLNFLGLNENDLSGVLPEWLGGMEKLETIWFSFNNLQGPIPSSIGDLEDLKYLWLSGNQLDGQIPDALSQCDQLEELKLGVNQLSGPIPSSLSSLTSLSVLELDRNELSGPIPPEFSNFSQSNLKSISLSSNNLEGCIPEELSVLCGQVELSLFGNPKMPWKGSYWNNFCNQVDEVGAICDDGDPETFVDTIWADCSCRGSMIDCDPERDSLILVELYYATKGEEWLEDSYPWGESQWLEPGTDIGSWYGIRATPEGCVTEIDLRANNLVDTIPASVANLSLLSVFNVRENSIEYLGFMDSIPQMQAIKELRLIGNQLSGPLPESLFNHPALTDLSFSNNEFSGPLPEAGANCILENIFFSGNNFEGTIPASWGNIGTLRNILLRSNDLSGPLPASLGNLNNLRSFDVLSNSLSGEIPETFGNLENLVNLGLSSNAFNGSIPGTLSQLSNLRTLNLSVNTLTGEIPPLLGDLELTFFSAYDNDLSGCFPESLKSWCTSGAQVILSENDRLPWKGDFTFFCEDQNQIGATCDDGNPQTEMDSIGVDCLCEGKLITSANALSLEQFDAFPNPSTGFLTIRWSEPLPELSVGIYNTLGEQLQNYPTQGSNQLQIQLPPAAGMYFVTLENEGNIIGKRSVVRMP
jgi:Leucine-rich repeat (LRR) protein